MPQVECPACKGKGKAAVFQNAITEQPGGLLLKACPACHGSGKTTVELADKLTKRQRAWDKILNG